MRIVVMSIVLLILGMAPALASADCRLLPPVFGQRAEEVTLQHNLNLLSGDENISTSLTLRGTRLCEDLPEGSEMTLRFLEGQFVQIRIDWFGSESTLLDFAEKRYGEAQGKPNPNHPQAQFFDSSWDQGDVLVTYSAVPKDNGVHEYLELTSRKHADLFGRANKKEEDAYNAMQERGR
ncbi:MAG: hypothetical protein KDD76_00210 [Rickettsiales bacterium]|nr:hypothetical protein [Rickettsiales bacterium]